MKNKLITIVVLFVLLLSFIGCDKYHRNRYVGNWDFVTERSFCIWNYDSINPLIVIKQDTVYYSGKISLGNLDNELYVNYTNDNEIITWLKIINNDVCIFNAEASDFSGKYSSGHFDSNNKMYLFLRWHLNYSTEYPYDIRNETIIGNKKKGGKSE